MIWREARKEISEKVMPNGKHVANSQVENISRYLVFILVLVLCVSVGLWQKLQSLRAISLSKAICRAAATLLYKYFKRKQMMPLHLSWKTSAHFPHQPRCPAGKVSHGYVANCNWGKSKHNLKCN